MKDLISKALYDAYISLEKQVPQTRKKFETISIRDINPSELSSFMKSNDIPDNACFSGTDNGYDGWNDIVLAWEVDISTTEAEKLEFKKNRFSDVAFKKVFDLLTANGYKRISGFNRDRISYKSMNGRYVTLFDKKTVYDMYVNKDLDALVDYYSMYYSKEL